MSFKPQPIHIFMVQYGLYTSKGWQGGFSLYTPIELDTPFPRGPCLHIWSWSWMPLQPEIGKRRCLEEKKTWPGLFSNLQSRPRAFEIEWNPVLLNHILSSSFDLGTSSFMSTHTESLISIGSRSHKSRTKKMDQNQEKSSVPQKLCLAWDSGYPASFINSWSPISGIL